MDALKFTNGAFSFYVTTDRCQPMDPLDIADLAQRFNVPPSVIPPYAGDRAIVSRAVASVHAHLGRQGFLLRPIRTTKTLVLYGIINESKDEAAERLDHRFDATLKWSIEHDGGLHIVGDHDIARQAESMYQQLRGKIDKPDWTSVITAYLVHHCDGQPVREDGRVFWIPPQKLLTANTLGSFLGAVGVNLVMCQIESTDTPVAVESAEKGLAAQLADLQTEVAAFDGSERTTTLRARIETFETMRRRATMYKAVLGIGTEQVHTILKELETKVASLLSVAGHKTDITYLRSLLANGDGAALLQALESGAVDVPKLPESW